MVNTLKKMKFQTLTAVPFTSVSINDRFWSRHMKVSHRNTVTACLTQCENTGRISNFAKAADLMEGEFVGTFYNDSDLYKVLEGVAYTLLNEPDAELEAQADRVIDYIVAAQQEDGYLQTYFTLAKPDQKWTDMNMHEDYCAGHLIEAAIAYKQATGKRKLLDAAIRLADHIDSLFGPGKRHWVAGHQEIELALVKLHVETNDERYWKLAYWFLEERGHGHGIGYSWDRADWGAAYCQDDLPVRNISKVTGHAVRAMYMYAGMADVAALAGDRDYIAALERIWDNVVKRNMYITGGIGPSNTNEGFTEDYDLPNASAYCETCASVGMVLWNHRMNLLHGDGKYADIVERAMYNGALAGVSLAGDTFFYVNPLESSGKHHREEWYSCSCCPTQIARFIPSIGNYVYALKNDDIYVNQYIGGNGILHLADGQVQLKQTTDFPWDGKITITVTEAAAKSFGLKLRIPGWCRNFTGQINGETIQETVLEQGYLFLQRNWKVGDEVVVTLDTPVERVHAHPNVKADQGKAALQRGPIVFCVEETDNVQFGQIELNDATKLQSVFRPDLLGGVVTLIAAEDGGAVPFKAVPYYAWDNRAPGQMRVWLSENKDTGALYDVK